MAGNVVVKRLEKPTPPKCLLDGMYLWKWEEGDNAAQKMFFKVDENGYFLSARGDDANKSALIWDLVLVSDVRSGKVPKEGKLHDSLTSNLGEESLEDCCRTLVFRTDGIIKLTSTYLMAKNPEAAQIFTLSINKLSHHLLDHLLPVYTYMKKHYVRLCLESNGHGQLSLKTVRNLMMVPKSSKVIVNYFESAKTNVKEMDDGTPYIDVSEFTEEIYMNLIDTLLQNRGPDLDTLKPMCKIKPRKQYIDAKEFATFLNTQQRDPRLNDILFARLTPEQAMTLMDKQGGDTDRLTMKDLLQYLMSDDNLIIDPLVYDQCQDMWKPLNHYFINSSHNTYLNGHQVRSESLTEMYAQVLLTGCRCVELDCWPRSDFDDIIITHGNTLCTKVPFKDVVETINEYAFVASEYPVILSIENHCNKYPKLISRMAEIFTDVFGDKLLSVPFDDFQLEPGVPLPSPQKLKGKIIIKDKVRAPKGAEKTATLQRGSTLPEVPEDAELATTTSPTKGEKPPPIEIVTTIDKAPSIDLPEKSPPPSTNKTPPSSSSSSSRPKLTPPLLSRPSLFKGMTILEDTDDDGPPPPKQDSIDEKSSLAKSPSVDTEPPDTPSAPDTKQPPETPKKENGTEGGATGTAVDKEEKKKYERGEALGASPLTELLNYVTAMSFGSFEASEKLNCHYIMSSFGEEKGMTLIKTKPKEFVRYNLRQNSRVYPAGGSRMNSSNYMPQIYWNVGCQMVALNFQTSDMPMQVNYAKFEMNGGTGYILKPSVMCMDRGFNPFVQKKIDDTVPARLSVKIISGMFITAKKTDLMVEVEMYGLPADIVRRRFTKKRAPGPHPFWDEDYFVFKRVLLPDLALLRLVVFDSDHVFIGQRVLPVNHLRAGFRHVSLRDKHNAPLGLANLFLHIKIEDYVPDEYEDIVAALENPLLFATRALEQLAMGTGADEDEFEEATDDGGPSKPRDREASLPTSSLNAPSDSPFNKRKESAPPELLTKTLPGKQQPRQSLGGAGTTGATNDVQKFNMSKSATLPSNFQGESESCLVAAKSRNKMTAMSHDSQTILENPEFLKIQKRYVKASADLASKQDKAVKKLQSDHSKALTKVSKKGEEQIKELETSHKTQLDDLVKSHKTQGKALERQCKIDLHEKQKFLLGVTHGAQMKALEKIQKDDLEKVKKELIQELKEKKKEGNAKDKNWLRGVEQDVFSTGMQTRSELNNVHDKEKQHFQKTADEAVKKMEEKHAEELEDLDDDDDAV